jgi:S-layer protein (TIGR01567 family)
MKLNTKSKENLRTLKIRSTIRRTFFSILIAILLFSVSLHASAAIQATQVEIRGSIADASALSGVGAGVSWNSANFAGFWYDLKTGQSTESLTVKSFNGVRNIDKGNLWYNSTIAPILFKVASEKNRTVEYGLDSTGKIINSTGGKYYDVVGWMGEKYVGINGKNNKLAELILEQGATDKKTLAKGETWDIGEGFTLTAVSLYSNTTPRKAMLVLKKGNNTLLNKTVDEARSNGTGTQGVFSYNSSIASESNVPIFVTYIDSVFPGATSDMVQLKYTWLINNSIIEVKAGDMYGIFKVDTENPLHLRSDSPVLLPKDSTVTLAGNMKFMISDSPDTDVRFYPMIVKNTPGTFWEVRGSVANATALFASASGTSWTSANFAGFWYDLKDNTSTEMLNVQSFNGARSIPQYNLWYITTTTPKMFKVASEKNRNVEYGLDMYGNIISTGGQYYDVVGWMGEKYVGINAKPNKLAKLLYEQDTSDKKTLTVGETWEMGSGYKLTVQSIDARSNPRLAWFVLSRNGTELDNKVIEAASPYGMGTQGVYTYYAKVGGEFNVPIFVTYIDAVFSGATSDMVQLKYTWLIDNNITEVKAGDIFGVFKVDMENPLVLKSDSSVSLSRDSIVTLAGELKFRVSDSPDSDVRFYPMIEYEVVLPPLPPLPPEPFNTLRFAPEAWNLVSVPKTLINSSVDISFDNLSHNVNNVKWFYDIFLNNGSWRHPTNILPLQGYWVYNNASTPVYQKLLYKSMPGPNLPPSELLKAGWNLIGHSSTQSMPVESALISIKGKYSHLLSYSPEEGWKMYIVGNPSLQQFNDLESGRGYWIFMTEDATYAAVDI